MVMTNSTFLVQPFIWDSLRVRAAMKLATGMKKTRAAEELGVDRVTLYHWLSHHEFAAEVDRLSLMVGIAGRAERMRIVMQVVEARTQEEFPKTEKDLLDWLKFAQSETDGAKIDLTKLRELLLQEDEEVADPSRLLSQTAVNAEVHRQYNNPLSLSAESLGEVIEAQAEPEHDGEPSPGQPATASDDNP